MRFSGKAKDFKKFVLFLEYFMGFEPSMTIQEIDDEIEWRRWKWENLEIPNK